MEDRNAGLTLRGSPYAPRGQRGRSRRQQKNTTYTRKIAERCGTPRRPIRFFHNQVGAERYIEGKPPTRCFQNNHFWCLAQIWLWSNRALKIGLGGGGGAISPPLIVVLPASTHGHSTPSRTTAIVSMDDTVQGHTDREIRGQTHKQNHRNHKNQNQGPNGIRRRPTKRKYVTVFFFSRSSLSPFTTGCIDMNGGAKGGCYNTTAAAAAAAVAAHTHAHNFLKQHYESICARRSPAACSASPPVLDSAPSACSLENPIAVS